MCSPRSILKNAHAPTCHSALAHRRAGLRQTDGAEVAVKMIRKVACRKIEMVRNLNGEIGILKRLNHPNVISMLDHWHERDHVCLVLKRHTQDLFSLSNNFTGGMPAQHTIPILRSTAAGLNYIHSQGVYHRDLKPENIMITGKGLPEDPFEVVIIDFGVSLTAEELDGSGMTRGLIGSKGFFAPEQLLSMVCVRAHATYPARRSLLVLL